MAVHLPKGTRDFLPQQMNARLHVIDTLRGVFARFGFEPLETPAFERIETLTGKYGDEGAKLIYKILKRGAGGERGECDSALRYDLTVPLARVMAMHPELRLPFKRYQIQPVWRADRPAKGRFREFWQCDVDICGTDHASADAECLTVVAHAMEALGFGDYRIRLNDRRILRAIARSLDAEDRESALLVAIDKLDKIGQDGVSAELIGRGFTDAQVQSVWQILAPQPDNAATLAHLAESLDVPEAVRALHDVLALAEAMGVEPGRIVVDATLARGLDYYTGPVYEVALEEAGVGSVGGGGRYDGLIGMFSGRDVPAVGVALGLERLLVVMEERDMLPDRPTAAPVLVTVMSDDLRPESIRAARAFRDGGVNTELYLGTSKLKSQFKYANARGYRYVVVIGDNEVEAGEVQLKDMREGGQQQLSLADAVAALR